MPTPGRAEVGLFFGSRDWTNEALIESVMTDWKARGGRVVVHGGHRFKRNPRMSADWLVDKVARRLGLEVRVYRVLPEEWKRSRRAGHHRNQRMLDSEQPGRAFGFISGLPGTEYSPGSADMASRCREAHVPLVVYRSDANWERFE